MTDDNSDLLDEFVTESLEGLANIENELLAIEESAENLDLNLVNKVFRAIHSIKGVSGFLGLETIGELSHAIENTLALMRSLELPPNSRRIDIILKASDALRTLVNDAAHSNGQDVSAHIAALKEIAAEAGKGAAAPTAEQKPAGAPAAAATTETAAAPAPAESTTEISAPPAAPEAPAPQMAAPVAATPKIEPTKVEAPAPVPAPAAAKPTAQKVEKAPEPHGSGGHGPEATAPAPASAEGGTPHVAETSIRVPVSLLDRLMNMAGEMVLERNRLLQTITVRDYESLASVAGRIDQVTSEMQEAVMQTRMQPIGNILARFPRIVRDLSRTLGKRCELTVDGKEVEVDKTIIEAIGDPLTHLIRNAVDHGVEMPKVREGYGKDPNGRIALRAWHQGGKVHISIADDGAGIDPAKLRSKAVSKGLMTAEEARALSDREALDIIFRAGFSTAEQVTAVSGRGVGMDVVKTNIERLGGTVDIETVIGHGTTFHVTLPLTLAIMPSLIVSADGHSFCIPQVNISEVVRVKAADVPKRIERIKGAEVFRLRDKLLPVIRLAPNIGITASTPKPPSAKSQNRGSNRLAQDLGLAELVEDHASESSAPAAGAPEKEVRRFGTDALKIVVVECGRLQYGLVVDAIFDSKEIVVKPLGRHLKGMPCLAGATILGDGKVSLILDVSGVAAAGNLKAPADDGRVGRGISEREALREVQTVLIFSNSPTELFAVPMSLVSRIERIKAAEMANVGGRTLMQTGRRSIPLLSLESYISASPREEQDRYYVVIFNVKDREVGLIAPKLVDICQMTDMIDTGILSQGGVSGSVVHQGKATRVLDLFELSKTAFPEWFVEKATEAHQPCVLLAEDNPFFRAQIRGVLAACGYSVVVCEDGMQAWESLSSSSANIDAIVTDIEMPRLDGLELTRRVKTDPTLKRLPVIVVTSLQSESDVQRGKDAGADDYQCKFNRERLIGGLEKMIQPAATPVG